MSFNMFVVKVWKSYAMKYYAAMLRNEVLLCATTWMNVQEINMNEKSHPPPKLHTLCILLRNIWNDKILDIKNWLVITKV